MVRRSVVLLLLLFIITVFALADDKPASIDTVYKRPSLQALRASNTIILDGKLDEQEWKRAGITTFTQRDPNQGQASSEKTEAWIVYDDEALYVAARLFDSPDSITSRIGRRDNYLNADEFYFAIDPYNDKRTGFYFSVYPSGTIIDGTLYNDSWNDNSWDGVWEAATNVDEQGWTVEMKIPYSQLRFPKLDEYVWGVNFGRTIQRKNEESFFVMVPKGESGWVSRFADLHGVKDINPPVRLEVLPYVVSSINSTNQYDDADPFHKSTSFSSNLGADIKYGLSSNFTLNATINPDFGQVEVDPAVVNLSQFETFFQEKRPFFIEGSNFFDFGYGGANNNWSFNWGSPDYFYSRRIGRSPRDPQDHGDYYTNIPNNTTILGAGKLTGKIGDNFSLGALTAITERENVEVEFSPGNHSIEVAEPLAAYSVVRGLNEFNKGQDAIGFIATGTNRQLNQPYLKESFNKNAYAFGVDGWKTIDSGGVWVLTGWGSTTRVEGSRERITDIQEAPLHNYQRPDAEHLEVDTNATSLTGYATRLSLNKQKGNIKFHSALGIISPGFESNDLGFLFRTDVINGHVVTGYRWYEPEGIFRGRGINVATFRSYDFDGNKFGEGYFLFYDVTFSNYWGFEGNMWHNPAVLDRTSTRGGPWMKTTNSIGGYIGMWTDSRSDIVGYFYVEGGRSESGGYRYWFGPEVEIKPSSNMSIRLSPNYTRDITQAQWVTNETDAWATNTYGTRHVFGMLDQHEFSGSIRLDWTFSPKLSLQLYLQPLISVGAYDHFKELKEPRSYSFNQYGIDNGSTIAFVDSTDSYFIDPDGNGAAPEFEVSNPNFSYKSLRGNAVLRWEYLPGSTLYFVWTRSGDRTDNPGSFKFGRDLGHMLTPSNHDDVFLIKLAYWITP